MLKADKILAIIPARGGSKRLPGKNIKPLDGKPMIAHVIEAARGSRYIDRVIVSTDNEKIASVAKEFGAEVPFMRPEELSGDEVQMFPVLRHAVNYMGDVEGFGADTIVLIQPTAPLILAEDIDRAIFHHAETGVNSCVSMCQISERPEWMYSIKDGRAVAFMDVEERPALTQALPKLYRINGAVYVIKKDALISKGTHIDDQSLAAIIMPQERSVDIDEPVDFVVAESLFVQTKKNKDVD